MLCEHLCVVTQGNNICGRVSLAFPSHFTHKYCSNIPSPPTLPPSLLGSFLATHKPSSISRILRRTFHDSTSSSISAPLLSAELFKSGVSFVPLQFVSALFVLESALRFPRLLYCVCSCSDAEKEKLCVCLLYDSHWNTSLLILLVTKRVGLFSPYAKQFCDTSLVSYNAAQF